jgi:hypothetical protein
LPAAAPFALRDFHWAFIAGSLLILCSVAGYLRLPKDAGHLIAAGH